MAIIVNGEKIEDSAIHREVERLRPDYERVFADQAPEEREAQLLDWSRENVIEQLLLNQEAKKDSYRIPASEVETALRQLKEQYDGRELDGESNDEIRQNVELELRVERMFREVWRDVPKPGKAAIEQYYEQNKEQLKSPERIRVGHIVKHVNWQTDEAAAYDVMRKAQAELQCGAVFEVLVQKYSDCPENGGDLGYVVRGQMVEEFEDVAFNLGVGQVSDVFRTRYGFHIAKLYDRRPPEPPSFEQAKDDIADVLRRQMRQEAAERFIDQLRSKADIEET